MIPKTVPEKHLSDLSKRETLEYILRNKAIKVVFQPIVDLSTTQVIGYEALSRGPRGRLQSPGVLFPYAMQIGMITALETVVCQRIAAEAAALRPKRLFVNLSATTLSNISAVKNIIGGLRSGAPELVLELTEHQAISPGDLRNLNTELTTIRQRSVGLAIDDVGSGFSRLQSIAELSPDWIKIDKPLVDQLGVSAMHLYIVRHLVGLAADIKARVIAEGVASKPQWDILRRAGVGYGQGYHFGRPMSVQKASRRLKLQD